ncbi:hypothetical protein DL96DRAFT_1666671 [Flagelloscypha sp. PMI_526]|nr:hypothetical protein DL96DRAFT_1666671 [Flagelloscypha sp. PMI_526]
MTMSDYLATDDLTVLLGLIAATLFLVQNLYKPQPLVHPILLGRQSDAARVRKPTESAVYRNYGTGLAGRFPVRPHKDVHILPDLVRPDSEGYRTLWKNRLSNVQLQDRVAAFGTGLLRLAGLHPTHSNVLLLLNDSIEFLISDLALAAHSIVSVTVTDSTLLTPVLEAYPPNAIITHAELLPHLLELLYEADDEDQNHTVIVVGEPTTQALAKVASKIKVINFEDVEREGNKVAKTLTPPPQPSDTFTVSFFAGENGQPQGRGHSLSSAYGRTIAYAALYENASFATLDSSKIFGDDLKSLEAYPLPSLTILFGTPRPLGGSCIESGRHRLKALISALFEGFITKDSLWDRLVYDGARVKVLGNGAGTLRGLIVSGGPVPSELLTPARVAFSIPLVNAFSHPLVAGPVLASHPLDVQDFPQLNLPERENPVGKLIVRGPPVGRLYGVDDYGDDEGWTPTNQKAMVLTNGAFHIF